MNKTESAYRLPMELPKPHCKNCKGKKTATYVQICRTCGGSGIDAPKIVREQTHE